MQIKEGVLKGLLRQKCVNAIKEISDMLVFLSDAPENIAIKEEADNILFRISYLSKRFK